jgi:imidazolonepropionase-like amidohydrolase
MHTGAIVFFAIAAAGSSLVVAARAEVLAVSNVTLIDGTADAGRAGMTVVVEGERIVAVGGDVPIPAGATIVDGTNKFLMPGLADLHNHVVPPTPTSIEGDRAALQGLLAWGITSVFSPGMDLPAFRALKQAATDEPQRYPRYFSAGHVIVLGEGFEFPRASWSKPTTPDAARAEVRAMEAAGADLIKFLLPHETATSPLLPEMYAAIVGEAHRLGLKAVAHAPELAAAKAALRAGADGLAHGIYDEPVDEELVALMKRNAAFYMSTSALLHLVADPVRWAARARAFDNTARVPAAAFELLESPELVQAVNATKAASGFGADSTATLQANLLEIHAAGIPVVIGTDTPVLGLIPGLSTLLEMQLHVDAGLSSIDAIRAATVNAQRVLGRDAQSGTIEVGKLAELILLYADPLADIGNLRSIKGVIQAGVYVDVVRD